MKKAITWVLILGLIYLFVLWFIAQSPYRCHRIDYLPYLKLMCDKPFVLEQREYTPEELGLNPEEASNNLTRQMCAHRSGGAKSDFAAKKIYENCLKVHGIPK